MEASALPAPGLTRPPLRAPLLRLRSDEQLVDLFRAGSEEAFNVLHDRYRQRLFAYVRQMLSAGSRQDAEDVMQDVFVRAYGALRANGREMNVRAWLYRVAHNRCVDHLRRPVPVPAEVFEVSRRPLHDPLEEAQRREDLSRLVADIAALPEHQRSALLMREIDGMSYQDLATALDVTVPAVKSLLVRARMGLVEAAEARDADCAEIRRHLVAAYDRGVKASGHARRHMRSCAACARYRTALRGMRRSFAALTPVGFGPLALAAKLLGISGGGAAAGAGAGATAGGASVSAVAGGGALATATACKVAAVVCTAAITAGGAVEAKHLVQERHAHHRAHPATAAHAAAAPVAAAPRPVTAPAPAVRSEAKVQTAAPRTAPTAPVDAGIDPAPADLVGTADEPADGETTETTAMPTPVPTPTATPAAGDEDAAGATATPAPTLSPSPASGTAVQPAPTPAPSAVAGTTSATPPPASASATPAPTP